MIQNNQIQPHQETRSITIRRAVKDFILKTSMKEIAFADDVVNHYHRLVPNPEARTLRFHSVQTDADMKANKQLLFRMLNGEVKLIADIEEAIVFALPYLERSELLIKLAARYGLLAAEVPTNTASENIASIGKFMNGTGQLIESLVPMIEDGVIDSRDRPFAKEALLRINATMGALVSWKHKIEMILPIPDKHDNIVPLNTENNDSA